MRLSALMTFGLGAQLTPVADGTVGRTEFALSANAHMRGSQCHGDPIRDGNPRGHRAQLFDDARTELGVVPRN